LLLYGNKLQALVTQELRAQGIESQIRREYAIGVADAKALVNGWVKYGRKLNLV
jgi:hypothetical protein